MSISNGIITAPISVNDPYDLLGVPKPPSGWDLAFINGNKHGRINVWSIIRPYNRAITPEEYSKEQIATINLIPPKYPSAINNYKWTPIAPVGGITSPYNLTDFNGYSHNALPYINWVNGSTHKFSDNMVFDTNNTNSYGDYSLESRNHQMIDLITTYHINNVMKASGGPVEPVFIMVLKSGEIALCKRVYKNGVTWLNIANELDDINKGFEVFNLFKKYNGYIWDFFIAVVSKDNEFNFSGNWVDYAINMGDMLVIPVSGNSKNHFSGITFTTPIKRIYIDILFSVYGGQEYDFHENRASYTYGDVSGFVEIGTKIREVHSKDYISFFVRVDPYLYAVRKVYGTLRTKGNVYIHDEYYDYQNDSYEYEIRTLVNESSDKSGEVLIGWRNPDL